MGVLSIIHIFDNCSMSNCFFHAFHYLSFDVVILLNFFFIGQTYRSSMLNAFKKTLDEGNFTFVIGMSHFKIVALG